MLNLKQRIGAGIATAAMASSVFAGAAFASSVTVSGNGAFSENDVDLDVESNTNVEQTSTTDVRNAIVNVANTGGVVASFNTGGDVDVQTGDATAVTNVSVQGGDNLLDLGNCSTCGGTDVWVTGNGAFSTNDVDVDSTTNTDIRQEARTQVLNNIVNAANTGGIVGSFNTGSDVNVETGDATAVTDVHVEGGSNFADLGNCLCGGGVDVKVAGNGAFSENDVDVDVDKDVNVEQESDTDVRNDIVNVANTGLVASFSTGGHDFDYGHKYKKGHGGFDFGKYFDKGHDYGKDSIKNRDRKYGGFDFDKYGKSFDKYFDKGHDFGGMFDKYNKYKNDHYKKKTSSYGNYDWLKYFFDGYFGGNTGGDVNIETGDADARVDVRVTGGDNVLN